MATMMSKGTKRTVAIVVLVGLLLSGLLAGVVSYYASSSPDGLEKVAADQGFGGTAQDSAASGSPLAGYGVDGVGNDRLSVGLAGIAGVVITLLIAFALFWLLARRRPATAPGGVSGDSSGDSSGDAVTDPASQA